MISFQVYLIDVYLISFQDSKVILSSSSITDWFDGLNTFMRYICHKSWFGGWLMPQKKSYFALQLPKGWWVFGLDLALHGDIDVYQFKFFSELIKDKVLNCYLVILIRFHYHLLNWKVYLNWLFK